MQETWTPTSGTDHHHSGVCIRGHWPKCVQHTSLLYVNNVRMSIPAWFEPGGDGEFSVMLPPSLRVLICGVAGIIITSLDDEERDGDDEGQQQQHTLTETFQSTQPNCRFTMGGNTPAGRCSTSHPLFTRMPSTPSFPIHSPFSQYYSLSPSHSCKDPSFPGRY